MYTIRSLPSLSRCLFALLLILIVVGQSLVAGLPVGSDNEAQYSRLALQATDWITSFQVTPLNDTWGIPYQNERAWGLDPYLFANGTITAGIGNITGGEKQTIAYLIGGHDAGEGASAALDAFMQTRDPRYLQIFNVYYGYFQNAQIPGPRAITPSSFVVTVGGRNTTIVDAGYWAEQASVVAGVNGTYGSDTDRTTLDAVYPAAEPLNIPY